MPKVAGSKCPPYGFQTAFLLKTILLVVGWAFMPTKALPFQTAFAFAGKAIAAGRALMPAECLLSRRPSQTPKTAWAANVRPRDFTRVFPSKQSSDISNAGSGWKRGGMVYCLEMPGDGQAALLRLPYCLPLAALCLIYLISLYINLHDNKISKKEHNLMNYKILILLKIIVLFGFYSDFRPKRIVGLEISI